MKTIVLPFLNHDHMKKTGVTAVRIITKSKRAIRVNMQQVAKCPPAFRTLVWIQIATMNLDDPQNGLMTLSRKIQ